MEHLKIDLNLIGALSAETTVLSCRLYFDNFTCRYFRRLRISKLLLFELACRRHLASLDGAVDMGIGGMRLLS